MADIPIIIRPALKRACCEGDACRAAIYNQLLYSIARKVRQGEEYWYGTQKEICEILDNCWSLSKVVKELNVLVDQGFLQQRHNPKSGWDQTRQYLFGPEEGQKFKEACEKAGVCVDQMGFGEDVLHLLNLRNAISKSSESNHEIHQMESVNVLHRIGKSSDAIPKSTTKNTTENTSKKGRTPTPTHALSEPEKLFWSWWLEVDQNRKVPPSFNETAAGHVTALAPHISRPQQLESLVTFTRKKMSQRLKRTVWKVELGNLRAYYAEWDQANTTTSEMPDGEKTVIWSKTPHHKETEALEHWYLYEHMTIAEARKYGYDDEYLPLMPLISGQIANKLSKLAKGEISLPPAANDMQTLWTTNPDYAGGRRLVQFPQNDSARGS